MDDAPWARYEKDRLPPGWSYPLGRDRIARLLREAGATLDSLHFSSPGRPPWDTDRTAVLRILCVGNGQARCHGGSFTDSSRLHMNLYAVPGNQRVGIGEQLEAGTLQRACQWATEALAPGNVWAATSHELFVIYERGRLQVAET